LAVGLAARVMLAAVPDSTGAITGCYRPGQADHRGGAQLSVVDTESGGACRGSESAVVWSQTGPEGPPGPMGLQGPPGAGALAGWEVVQNTPITGGGGGVASGQALCPEDKIVVGGSIRWNFGGTTSLETASFMGDGPFTNFDGREGWKGAILIGPPQDGGSLDVFAFCVFPPES
jgi:hypothetical protein